MSEWNENIAAGQQATKKKETINKILSKAPDSNVLSKTSADNHFGSANGFSTSGTQYVSD